MSFTKIMIHAVWGTKNRQPFLTKEKRPVLFEHIRTNASGKGIRVDAINGHFDHIHCLFELNPEMALSKALQLMKGEASHWANAKNLFTQKLDWADEYFAVSVSESVLDAVRAYIRNQEEHHKKVTFLQEYDAFMKKYGWQRFGTDEEDSYTRIR